MPSRTNANVHAASGARFGWGRRMLCVAAVLAAGPEARATELYFDYPVPILLQRPTTALFYSKRLEDEVRTRVDSERKRDFDNDVFRLNFQTNGWVYHPALVTFDLGLSPEFVWRKSETSPGDERSDKLDFLGYSVDTTWLQEKPYTLRLRSLRDRRDISSSLAADVTTESSADSVSLLLTYPILPTTLTYSENDTITDGFFRTEMSQERWQLDSRMETEKSDTRLSVTDIRQDRLIRDVPSASDRFNAALANTYFLGTGGRLTSQLNLVKFANLGAGLESSNRTTNLASRLDLTHRENLDSFYSVNLNKNDLQQYPSNSAALQAGFTHRLYENLTSTFRVSHSKTSFSDGDIRYLGGNMDFTYNRRIPWGELTVDLGLSERIQDNQVIADFVQVQDERHVFEGIATTIILDNINIDTDSIEVTDATGTIVYVRGIDYQVDSAGQATVIVRDPFAGIGDNATVLVSYRYDADPPAKLGLTGTTYGVQFQLWENRLRLYVRGSRLEERLIDGIEPFALRHDRTKRVGAQLNLRWSKTRVEFEDRDSINIPVERQTLSQSFNFTHWQRLSLSIAGQISKTRQKDTGEQALIRGVNVGIGWRVGPGGGQLRAGAYMRENRHIDEHGFKLNYRWRYGAWYPLIRYEYVDEFNGFVSETRKRELIYLEVKRKFR